MANGSLKYDILVSYGFSNIYTSMCSVIGRVLGGKFKPFWFGFKEWEKEPD